MRIRTGIVGNLIAIMASAGFANADYFDIPVQYQVTGKPWSIFAADLNDDDFVDIATVSYQTDTLTIMLNAGDGTFPTKVKYPTGDVPVYVHGADINGDSAIDLAVANKFDNTVSLYINNGDGTFASQVTVESGYHPSSTRLADLDNDSIQDLVVTNEQATLDPGSDSISVLYGNGDGTFQSRVSFQVEDEPQESEVADFNGDNYLDIAVVNIRGHNISVLLNDGSGSFGSHVNYESHYAPTAISVADLNNDTYVDIIAPNSDAYDRSEISIILNKGDGSFDTTVYVNSGGYPLVTFTSDLDHDNDVDIIVANWMTDSLSILINNGDATFEDPVQLPTGDTPASVFAADLDGDTFDDLAIGNRNSNEILVYVNEGMASSTGDIFEPNMPSMFEMYQNAPNPFNPSTTIEYFLESRTRISLTIHNILGQQVALLVDEIKSPGIHRIQWDGTNSNGELLATGIYFYRLTGDNTSITRKMVLLK